MLCKDLNTRWFSRVCAGFFVAGLGGALFLLLLYVCECFPACMSVYCIHTWYLQRPAEASSSLGLQLYIDGYEPSYGFLELNSCPLKEQQMLLTAELFLQASPPPPWEEGLF